jgi:hypothetical protein
LSSCWIGFDWAAMMGGIQVERYNYARRRTGINQGCGCLLLTLLPVLLIGACAGLYVTGLLVPIVLNVSGMDHLGDTDTLFDDMTAQPTVSMQNPVNQSRVVMQFGEYGQEVLDANTENYMFVQGADETGLPTVTATFTELGLLDLCNRRGDICSGGNGQYRNAWIDLRTGGAVVYVDVNVGMFWQTIGLVLQLNATRTRIDVVGVDIDNSTYDANTLPVFLPNETRTAISSALTDVESTANDIMREMLLSAGGENYRLMDVQVNDTTLTLILR